MPLPAIGYVTSGKYAGSFKSSFLQGLTQGGFQGDPTQPNPTVDIHLGEADGTYDARDTKQVLNKHVARLSKDNDVKLIVAVGGLVSAYAAVKRSDKPFLVLIGQTPAIDDFEFELFPSGNFCGGVNLATTAANVQRNAAVAAKAGCKPNEVCLIFNENARMARAERHAWKSQGWPSVAGGVDADGDNDADDFKRVFKRAANKRNAKAVVISSDPFFAHNRNDLVSAANASSLFVCYPSKYFGAASPAPTVGRDIWCGPHLDDAYQALGKKAGQLLARISAGSAAFMDLDTAPMAGPTPF